MPTERGWIAGSVDAHLDHLTTKSRSRVVAAAFLRLLLLALFAVQPATSMAQQVQIYWVE